MKKISVFGKPASGKSTLSKNISRQTGINLHPLDLIEYKKNGEKVSFDKFEASHEKIIRSEAWIIEGLGPIESFWKRLGASDTLVYVDLPYSVSYWWSIKRLLLSFYKKPEGWPEGSSVFKGTLASFKYLKLSPKFWNQKLLDRIEKIAPEAKMYHLTSVAELKEFIQNLDRQSN